MAGILKVANIHFDSAATQRIEMLTPFDDITYISIGIGNKTAKDLSMKPARIGPKRM